MPVIGESSDELLVQVTIRNPIPRERLTATQTTKNTMNSKLYVGNLSFNTTEANLRSAFGSFGTLTDVFVATDHETGRPRGFAFVTFSTEEESKLAVEKMNGVELDGRALTVNEAKPKEAGNRNFGPDRRPFQARKRY
jgi:cold-inducible RNA-binding protein